jgi:hypothetical protein
MKHIISDAGIDFKKPWLAGNHHWHNEGAVVGGQLKYHTFFSGREIEASREKRPY